jgi:ligand-binding SRPBCC domain-containing protein
MPATSDGMLPHDDRVKRFSFSFETRLAAEPAVVWAHATSMAGVNSELFPLARMTSPRSAANLGAADIVPGRRVFRSWIFALGVLPVDYDDLTFVEFEAPRRFLERSPMLSQRWWQHERTVEAVPGGTLLRDRVEFEPRSALLGRLQLPVFRLVFANRHRRLARMFGRC